VASPTRYRTGTGTALYPTRLRDITGLSPVAPSRGQDTAKAGKPVQTQTTQQQQAPQGATPGLAKVSQQHAIAKTKADITAVQTIARKRTQIVLQAFDEAMADSDSEIIAGLEARLGGESDGFFGFDLEAEFAALLTKPEAPIDEPPAGEQTPCMRLSRVSSRCFSHDNGSKYANRSNDWLQGFYGLLKRLNHTNTIRLLNLMQNITIPIDHDKVALIEVDKQMIAEAKIRVKNNPLTLEQILEKVRK
jgi:hypothetical protein